MAWSLQSVRWSGDARITSDAIYRAQGKWISDALTTLGWGKTADTGQIDWTTATRPGAPTANTKGGYEVRVSSGAGTDIYLKISYGLGYNTNSLGVWMETGEGSDGAGTITGDKATEKEVGTAMMSAAGECSYFLAGDSDNFVLAGLHDATAANGFWGGVQRTCDSSGVDTATGWFQHSGGYSNGQHGTNQYVSFASGAATQDTTLGILNLPRNVGPTSAAMMYVPLFTQDGSRYYALRDVLVCVEGSLYSEHAVSHYGSSKNWKVFLRTNASTIFGGALSYTAGVMVRMT